MASHEHGYVRYAAGCRCDVCRAAWADYHRRRRRGLTRRVMRPARRRGTYYVGQTRQVTVALSDLGAQLLARAAQRTGQSENAVVERLLRSASVDLQFGDAA